jgi:type 1 glutamine amidotransferase
MLPIISALLRRPSLTGSAVAAVCALLLAAPGAAETEKLRVLLLTGGHSYEREPFLQVFRADPRLSVTHVEHSGKQADAWERADTSACDAVVLYDMAREITDAQKARFAALFARGTGVLAMHHALVSFQRWPDYERIIGGRWLDVPEKGGDPRETPSGYQHDVDISVHVARPHPITHGLGDFIIRDEIYWGFRVGKDVTPLLTTTHPKSGNPLMWERAEGKSRVVYLLLGHGPSAYSNPNYRQLVTNAVRYVARRSATRSER